jgi:hypothetical protein
MKLSQGRHKAPNPYLIPPETANNGLKSNPSITKHTIVDHKTKYFNYSVNKQHKAYSHTGSSLADFKPAPVDPKYKLPYYGNRKPLFLSYNMAKNNLLS